MEGITENFLNKNGFIQYDCTFINDADKCWEKEYETEYGTYFLNVKRYGDKYDDWRLVSLGGYEVFARLFKYGTHEQIDIKFDFGTIDEVNDFILELFKNKLIESCKKVNGV